MKFKQWLLNEISSIVQAKELNQDKIRLYHGTSTGENNERIESFVKQGARPIGSGHGQGGGFYVSTKLEHTKKHSFSILGLSGEKPLTGIYHNGKPMVVVLELDQIDFHEWDFDAELMIRDILTRGSRMLNKKPDKKWTGNISAKSAAYLKHDDGSKLDAGSKVVSSLSPIGTLTANYPNTMAALPYPGSKFYDKDETYNTGDARIMSTLYQAHQDSSQGRHEKLEAAAFRKMFDKKNIQMKYTGTKTLPVSEILVFDKNEWKSAYKT